MAAVLLSTIFSNADVSASEGLSSDVSIGTNSETLRKTVIIYQNWSTSTYNMDNYTGAAYKPFPTRIYKQIDGYVGYVTLQSFYQDKTVYRATYKGTLKKRTGPSVPLVVGKEDQ